MKDRKMNKFPLTIGFTNELLVCLYRKEKQQQNFIRARVGRLVWVLQVPWCEHQTLTIRSKLLSPLVGVDCSAILICQAVAGVIFT